LIVERSNFEKNFVNGELLRREDINIIQRRMPAPPSQVLALRFDQIVGKALSGILALLLLAIAKACALVAEDEYFSQS